MCWIDVKTQLPEEGEETDLWVVDPHNEDCKGFRVTVIAFVEGRFDLPKIYRHLVVTHWCYPPAPPESANAAKGD